MRNLSKYSIFRWSFIIASLLLEIAAFQAGYAPWEEVVLNWNNTGEWITSYSLEIITAAVQSIAILPILSLVILMFALIKQLDTLIDKGITFFKRYWSKSKWLSGGGIIASTVGFSIAVLLLPTTLQNFFVRLVIFEGAIFICVISMKALLPKKNWGIALIGSMLLIAAIYRVMIFIPHLSTSPFSLGWSEGSRYYYASLFFSNKVYGQNIPPSPWHASRYMLLAIPWVITDIPLWFHRLWQVFLWIGLTWTSGLLLAKRLKLKGWFRLVTFSAWAFLALFQGPVYYHLLVCVILILWGLDYEKPRQSFLVVVISSIWAGLSRVNWIPMPVFLAVTLYLLETPWREEYTFWDYVKKPLVWGIGGGIAAFSSYVGYAFLSGNQISKFGSSFTSALLWYRLFPNPSYQPGILLGMITISLPLWLVIFLWIQNRKFDRYSYLKLFGIGAILVVLLVGGLAVSVKIGGGSNLHNLDAYLVILIISASYMFWEEEEKHIEKLKNVSSSLSKIAFVTALVIPIFMALTVSGHSPTREQEVEARDLSQLQDLVNEAISQGGEVLFLTERQLQSFNLITGVPFVPEYEKVELMEMAMSGNPKYLELFYQDIKEQRFSIIISDSMHTQLRGRSSPFGEENDAWVTRVASIVLEYYQASQLGQQGSIYVLTPKP